MCRDKIESAGNKVGDYAGKVSQDVRNRASGIVAETKSLFAHEEVTDETLVDRVRSRLGRHPVTLGPIEISATGGTVILNGRISAGQLPTILKAVKWVRGVKRVENQLISVPDNADASELQGTPQPLSA
jgi:osmotically-inducible protein OsmY